MKIFAFIPKTSSTEIAMFDGAEETLNEVLSHPRAELLSLVTPAEQGRYRFAAMREALAKRGIAPEEIGVVVTQVASHILPPGIYMATSRLTDYLSESRLDENQYRSGVFAALMLSDFIYEKHEAECMPLAVVPATFDETLPETVFSGAKGISRFPIFAVFQQRIGAGYFALADKKVRINEVRVVTAHLGSAFSVGAFDMGRITDSNSPLDGEGPFSPTTSGTLPIDALIDLCYSGRYDMDDMLRMVSERGGLSAYLEDASLESVMRAYRAGDKKTIFLVKAMAYQVAREIGARAAALRGRPQAITLTGNWTYFEELVREISSRVEWIAPVKVYTIDSELRSLAIVANETYLGAYKILVFGQDRQ